MKTVQMAIDEEMLQAVEHISKQLGTSRSAFIRKAVRLAIDRFNLEQLEKGDTLRCRNPAVTADEFSFLTDLIKRGRHA